MPLPAYVWASNPDSQIDEPEETFWRRGFIDEEPVAAAHLNYVINKIQEKILADFALFGAEHDTSDGTHTDVTAQTLAVTGQATFGGGYGSGGSTLTAGGAGSFEGTVASDLDVSATRDLKGNRVLLNGHVARYIGANPYQHMAALTSTNAGINAGYPLRYPEFSKSALRVERDSTNSNLQNYMFATPFLASGYSGLSGGRTVSGTVEFNAGSSGPGATVTPSIEIVDGFSGASLHTITGTSRSDTGDLVVSETPSHLAFSFPTTNTGEIILVFRWVVAFDAGTSDTALLGPSRIAIERNELE